MLVRAGDSKVEYKQRVEGVAQHMANMAEKQVRRPLLFLCEPTALQLAAAA